MSEIRCYACDRPLKFPKSMVTTEDGQNQYVGEDCNARVIAAGVKGYQPPKGGPRLYIPNFSPTTKERT